MKLWQWLKQPIERALPIAFWLVVIDSLADVIRWIF